MTVSKFPEMLVTFDDGRIVQIQPRQSDVARAELLTGKPFAVSWFAMFAVAFCCLRRLGEVSEGLETFMDSVTIEWDD